MKASGAPETGSQDINVGDYKYTFWVKAGNKIVDRVELLHTQYPIAIDVKYLHGTNGPFHCLQGWLNSCSNIPIPSHQLGLLVALLGLDAISCNDPSARHGL